LTIKIRTIAVSLVLALTAGQASLAEESPHWKKDRCQVCHEEAMPADGLVNLKAADTETLCESCHGGRGGAKPCRHTSGIPLGDMDIDEVFRGPLKNDNVVCTTCHDVVYQCKNPKRVNQYENPAFLRDRDYMSTQDYCMRCHEPSSYAKLNPHVGVAGSPPRPTCGLCHDGIPATGETGEINLNFNMTHNLNDACLGCHKADPHPRNIFATARADEWIHFAVPSEPILAKMRKTEAELGIVLPLNPLNGEVFCATCHSPHEFKVGGGRGTQAGSPPHRLRISEICQACHEK
jgi:hypothetical protein